MLPDEEVSEEVTCTVTADPQGKNKTVTITKTLKKTKSMHKGDKIELHWNLVGNKKTLTRERNPDEERAEVSKVFKTDREAIRRLDAGELISTVLRPAATAALSEHLWRNKERERAKATVMFLRAHKRAAMRLTTPCTGSREGDEHFAGGTSWCYYCNVITSLSEHEQQNK